MGEVKLSNPRIRIVRDGQPDLELQTTNADLVLWDLTRPKQRPVWPAFNEAPFLWLTFLSWAAARRTGAIETGMTFEQWRTDVLDVADIKDEDDGPDDSGLGSPFPLGVEPG